jgi:CubicO group peptidase (beta-lactamase class C family)
MVTLRALVLVSLLPGAVVSLRPVAPTVSAAPRIPTRQLDGDTALRTPSGATFMASRGWFVTERKAALILEDPDRALTMAIVEQPGADAAAAVASAWKHVEPGFARRAKRTTRPPPRDGWDEIAETEYESTTQEARAVKATARRKDGTWYVVLLDGSRAALDRRDAQVAIALSSFKAPGMQEESWRGRTPLVLDGTRRKALDAFVEEARQKAKVPGVAIAVAQGGRIVHEKSFGVRALGRPERVTPGTRFMIGSITKSLTSLLMARLVDEGRFTWETPVKQILPWFELADAEATRKLTVRHTVCACTGIPRQDIEIFFGYAGVTPEGQIADMKSMNPTTGLGETFQYSNTMVSAGGYVAAHALHPRLSLGAAYDRAMKERVFRLVGMRTATLDLAAVKRAGHAAPHGLTLKGEYTAVPLSVEDWVRPIRPAGGVWSSVRDMARYLLLELATGATPEGRRVVSTANMLARREPQVKVNDKVAYALALYVEGDHGLKVVAHPGGTLGFTSLMFFLPDHDLGAVILTNAAGGTALVDAVRQRLLELLFDGKEAARLGLEFALREREETRAKEMAKIEVEPDRVWLTRFLGTYRNARLGTIALRFDGKRAVLDAGEWISAVGRKKEDDGTFKIVLLDPPWASFELLAVDRDGRRRLSLETAQQEYVFEPVE